MDDNRPADQPTDQEKLARARERVSAIKGFYIHLAIFIAVLLVLVVIDASTGESWWVQWVFLGWGIGILAHAVGVFASTPKFVTRWEERKIREYLDES